MIFCLSCTGNTLWAARLVAEATGERIVDVAAAVAAGHTHYEVSPGERVGFCFPVHAWRPPALVRAFARQLRVDGAPAPYAYALCTAGDNIGETMRLLQADLAASGLRLGGQFSLVMPESYVALPFFVADTYVAENRKKQTALRQMRDIVPAIVGREQAQRLVIGRWPRLNSRLLGWVFNRWLITDAPFRVDSAACQRCGVCAAHCPVQNITWHGGALPQWKRDQSCLACLACFHHCPQHAIEFGGRTRGKQQYYFERNGMLAAPSRKPSDKIPS